MSYFLTDQKLETNQEFTLSAEEARHILLARRMKKGDSLNLQDGLGNRFDVKIIEASKKGLNVKVGERVVVPKEPILKTTLFQAYVNEKALDFILQKTTELQVTKIVLFNSQNVATKLTKEVFEKKKERWNKILWEAAKQSDRLVVPELSAVWVQEELFKNMESLDQNFLCDANGENFLKVVQTCKLLKSCSVVVGPEGGFVKEEIELFKSQTNIKMVSLGYAVLRAETAALASVAILNNLNI